MTHLFPYLFFLACPVGMGLMMWMMSRGGQTQTDATPPPSPQPAAPTPTRDEEVTRLRAELDQLRAEERDRAPRP